MKIIKKAGLSFNRSGFSLIEFLTAVAIISTVGAGAVVSFTNVAGKAEQTKLRHDVALLNQSIRTYVANGGKFVAADLAGPDTILAKLKKRATEESGKQFAGLREGMIDSRLACELQTDGDAASDGERARFVGDPANPRFVIEDSGEPGVSRFVLDENLASHDFGTEERRGTNQLAAVDPWVWDYDSEAVPTRRPGIAPLAYTNTATAAAANSGNALPLNPPVFSIGGDCFPLLQFDLPLTFSNPNRHQTSSIHYSINGGSFKPYTGGAVPVVPGMTVSAYCSSNDPDDWEDSRAVWNEYTANIVPLSLAIAVPQTLVTYVEAGGAMLPGSVPPPPPAVRPELSVTNLDLIPASYQNSSSFTVQWTYDGTEPFSSNTAVTGAAFTNGFQTQPVDISLSRWKKSTSLHLKAIARSLKPAALGHSAVAAGMLTTRPMALREAVLTALTGGHLVGIAPTTSFGDTPAGFRIFFTTDGTEPAEANGAPVNGTLYTGPVNMPPRLFISADLKAKVFGPEGYERWFTPSATATLTKPSLASTSAAYAFLLEYHNAGFCPYTWSVLGPTSNVSGAQATINGTIAVGPGATLDFDKMTYRGIIATDPLGLVTGPAHTAVANIAPLKVAALALNQSAMALTPTQTLGEIISSTVITASAPDGMNIVNIQRIKLAASDTLTFTGGPKDFFIVNVIDSLELTGGSLIKIAGSLALNRVLINSPNAKAVKLTGGAGIMPVTFLAPLSNVTIGGSSTYTGNILSGPGSGLNGNPILVGGSPFGECDNCCD